MFLHCSKHTHFDRTAMLLLTTKKILSNQKASFKHRQNVLFICSIFMRLYTSILSFCVCDWIHFGGQGTACGFWGKKRLCQKKKGFCKQHMLVGAFFRLKEGVTVSDWILCSSQHISIPIMSSRHCDGSVAAHLICSYPANYQPSPAAPPAFDKNRGKLKSWTWIMNPMTR